MTKMHLMITCLLLFGAMLVGGAQEKYVQLDTDPGTILHKIGYSEADPGKEYMLVKISVENHGYEEFDLDPSCFKMTVNKIIYDREYMSSLAEEGYPPLEDVALADGGELSGYIVFSVPDGTKSYSLKYKQWSWDHYSIKWKEDIEPEPAPAPESDAPTRKVSPTFGGMKSST